MLKEQLDRDLKTALLAGDTTQTNVLRSLKSAILYAEVAQGARDKGLDEQEILKVLTKEAKKRQESADMYAKGGQPARADAELAEKKIIERYLPAALSEEEISKLVDVAIAAIGPVGPQTMGQIIGRVKQESQGAADGAIVARLVKERIS